MAMRLPGAPRTVRARPEPFGPGRLRKIAIIGTAPSLWGAPWDDPSWQIWAHASGMNVIKGGWQPDLLIDLHPPHCFREERKNGFRNYYEFLQHCRIPVLMQERYDEIPASVRFPRERLLTEWPGVKYGSLTSYLIAYALMQGVTHLGFWGIHYAHKSEYEEQRANTEHWIGIARGQGVQIIIPADSPLCHEPAEDYGYESHSTPEKYAARKERVAAFKRTVGVPGAVGQRTEVHLLPLRTMRTLADFEEAAAIRAKKDPAWGFEVAKFGKDEEFPQWILDLEAQQRDDAARSLRDAGSGPAASLRHSDGVAQVLASESARRTDTVDAGGNRAAPVPSDAVVQPPGDADHAAAPGRSDGGGGAAARRRAVVAGQRGPARPKGPRAGVGPRASPRSVSRRRAKR